MHMHLVLNTLAPAEQALTAVKAATSQAFNLAGLETPERRRWTRHDSMRSLRDDAARETAIRYVVPGQGAPMAVYEAPR